MKERVSRIWRKYSLELLVLLLCGIVLSIGISRKEGYHMDELLSFELSNARFTPWIVPTQPQGRLDKFVEQEIEGETLGETLNNLYFTVKDVLENRGSSKLLSYQADVYEEPVWISGEEFQDYITVQDKDAFQYLSVYFNVKDDNHPPLHFMLLHTMSSIFRGMAEPFMGCMINLAAVLGIIWLLMALGRGIARAAGLEQQARFIGIMAGTLYGLSAGALATVLLIRMYAMLTFFCVALCYVHWNKWQREGFTKGNKILLLLTVLGFWTQYFFLFYCLLLALVTAVLLWKNSRIKELLVYVRTMVLAAVIGVVLFPFAIGDVFSSGRGTEALENLSDGLSGFGGRLWSFGEILTARTIPGNLWMYFLLLLVLFMIQGKIQANKTEIRAHRKDMPDMFFLFALPVVGYFLLAVRMSPYLVDRYIMPVFPFVFLGAAMVTGWMVQKWKGEKPTQTGSWIAFGLLFLAARILVPYDGEYLYPGYEEQEEIAETYASEACICIYDGVGYYENLKEFTHYRKTLLTTLNELEERQDKASIEALDQVVVVVKQNVDVQEAATVLLQEYGLTIEKELLENGGAHGDQVLLCIRE